MNSNLTRICYQGETGESDLRTLMPGIIRALLQAPDSDEYITTDAENSVFEGQKEIFVTWPGLYRVMSGDQSTAGKRFQKWLFHEVILSLTKHGS